MLKLFSKTMLKNGIIRKNGSRIFNKFCSFLFEFENSSFLFTPVATIMLDYVHHDSKPSSKDVIELLCFPL